MRFKAENVFLNLLKAERIHKVSCLDNILQTLSFQPTISGDGELAVSNIERCVLEIDHWMLVNRLKLNKKKTELLVMISAKHLPMPIVQEIPVVSETIRSSQKARNIGVTFDNHVLFNDHVASICKSSFYHLRNISYIRKYLSSTTT